MKTGKVSVIIPTYNHAQFLSAAIQSVLSQTYQNFEIIVVDDGSTDNTKEVVGEFGSLVRFIWQENQGLSAARNTGLRLAQGEYIGFLDADDIWLPEFLHKQLLLFKAAEIGATYCGSRFVDVRGNLLPQVQVFAPPPDEFQFHLLDGAFFPVHAVLLRKKCLQETGEFDENLRALEDWDMWLRFSRKFYFVGNPQIYVLTRVRSDSMSADFDRMATQEQALIQKHYPDLDIRNEIEEAEYMRLLGNAALRISVSAVSQREWEKGAEHLAQAFTVYPGVIHKLSTYYSLLMAELPRGRKTPGELKNLDQVLNQLRNMITDTLLRLPNRDTNVSRSIYRGLYYAAGQIAFAQHNQISARSYLFSAVQVDQGLVLDREFIGFLAKSLLPIAVLNRLRLINLKFQRR
jgi:glycosyltransferase involved in cell wall biosynthesis